MYKIDTIVLLIFLIILPLSVVVLLFCKIKGKDISAFSTKGQQKESNKIIPIFKRRSLIFKNSRIANFFATASITLRWLQIGLPFLVAIVWIAIAFLCSIIPLIIGLERFNEWTSSGTGLIIFLCIYFAMVSVFTFLIVRKIRQFIAKQEKNIKNGNKNLG